jgi:aspartate 1-decarboxylase
MLLTILKSKLHRAVVTETDIDYVGSVTIDETLMNAVGILPFEQVHVWNLTNGSRIITYAISAPKESGIICLNGAAAHLTRVGDRIIIGAFAQMDEKEAAKFKPRIAIVTDENKIGKIL